MKLCYDYLLVNVDLGCVAATKCIRCSSQGKNLINFRYDISLVLQMSIVPCALVLEKYLYVYTAC